MFFLFRRFAVSYYVFLCPCQDVNEVAHTIELFSGSLVVIGTRNKQTYFSLNKNKNTRLIYLGKKREDKAREYSKNYKKFLEIVEEMTIINMTLLKENACL